MAGASEPEPPPLPSPSPPPLGLRLAEPPPLATSRTASLVGLRRMMFENISHTDDEKLPGRGKSDVVVEPNKLNFSAKRPVEFNRNSSHRLSDSKIMKGDSGTVASNREIVKSDSVSHKTEIGSDFQCDSDPVSHTSSDSSRPKLVISHHTPEEDGIVVTTEVDEKDGFSSLNVTTDLRIVEAENADVVSVQKLDVDSDLEPNSCSSDLSVVQAKNEVINNSDDEIEYNKLVESKESIENNTVETRSDTIPEETEKVEVKSVNNETEGLLSHAESGSLKDAPDEITENVDEFTSLTHNIEQLVIEAKNEDVINSSDEKGETVIAKDESVSEMLESEEKRDVSEPKVPTPSERVVKHKPPTPQARKVSRALVMPKEEKKKPLEDYPEELNPFGDDDDNELKEKPASTNPFGSSDEEEEEDSSLRKEENVPKPAARKVVPAPKINLNPFWSGDEEEEEENTTPIPKPRKLRTPKPSPEPSPQPRRLRSATGSLGSSSSIASRKKKPAPLPPNWHTLGTPGSRKSYSAPRPPHHPRTVTPSPPPLPTSSPPTSRPASPLPHDDKQFFNRQRQNSIVSETSSIGTISSYTPHKSMYGQWKRKKGPAPARPVPVRRAVQPMPLASVRQELADIEIKQQGLERQGVKLEQTIRDKFEQEGASLTPYVEEMVLQLFELVNEKNELFRRQAELMYLRRQHNLEEEHAELEYQIRCLMLCPEHNKTDSDKEKEEQLIQRLVEVVERRNEIIDCLEMDRLREKEEDRSVGTQLGIFSAAMGSEVDLRVKTDKKGKKLKKEKRWSKRDLDKEVEDAGDKKKSKKKWFTLHHSAKS